MVQLRAWHLVVALAIVATAGCLADSSGPSEGPSALGNESSGGSSSNASRTWSETGQFTGAGLGGGWGAWEGGPAKFPFTVDPEIERVEVGVQAPRVNASAPGGGHAMVTLVSPDGTWHAPEGAQMVFPLGENPVVVQVPLRESYEVTVDDPAPGRWTAHVGPYGPAAQTAFVATFTLEAGPGDG